MKTIEIIPLNKHFSNPKMIQAMHFSHIKELELERTVVDLVIFLEFVIEEEIDDFRESIVGTLELFNVKEYKMVKISGFYPQIVKDLNELKNFLIMEYPGSTIYLNLSTLETHIHAFILRDILHEKFYDFFSYEVLNPMHGQFNFVIIPNFEQVRDQDWDVVDLLLVEKDGPISIEDLIKKDKIRKWNVSYKDQSLRRRLDKLEKYGLIEYEVGSKGERKYYLKDFQLNKKVLPLTKDL